MGAPDRLRRPARPGRRGAPLVLPALLLLLPVAGLPAQGGEPDRDGYRVLRTYLLPPRFYVGDPVELRLELEGARGASAGQRSAAEGYALPPELLQELAAGTAPMGGPQASSRLRASGVPELRLDAVTVRATGADRVLVSIRFRPYRTGKLRLPALPLGGLLLDGVEVQVLSALEGQERPADPRAQLPLRGTAVRLALLALGGIGLPLLAVLAAVLGLRSLRRARLRYRRERPGRKMRRLLQRLARVSGRLEPRQFHFRLSAAVREYLGARFGIPARGLTTAELADWMAGLGSASPGALERAAAEVRAPLIGLLEHSDQVKFGGETVSARAAAEVLEGLARVLERIEQAALQPAREEAHVEP